MVGKCDNTNNGVYDEIRSNNLTLKQFEDPIEELK